MTGQVDASSGAGLWRRPDFLRLWAGQTVSAFGSQVTRVALPLTAVLVLGASPVQMGLLRAAADTPAFALGLVAGAWVDRVRRRPLLIAAELAQAVTLASVPLAAALGVLSLAQLAVVVVLSGCFATLFAVAHRAYVPSLVGGGAVVDANGKLATTGSAAELAGPGLGGVLVQLLGPPLAIAADAASYALSAAALLGIAAREAPVGVADGEPREGFWWSIGDGIRFIVGDPALRVLAGSAGLFNLFDGVIFAVYVLYVTRGLGVPPVLLGAIFAAGGAGGLIGALLAGRAARRFGLGRALLAGLVLATAGESLIPLAGGGPAVAATVLAAAEVAVGLGAVVYQVNGVSLRQLVTPAARQGRVHATTAVISSGLGPLGALAGGVIGQTVGLRACLVVGALGTLLAVAWLVASPARSLR